MSSLLKSRNQGIADLSKKIILFHTTSVILEDSRPLVAVAKPYQELVFPVGSTTLDGSRSSDGHGIVLYHRERVMLNADC